MEMKFNYKDDDDVLLSKLTFNGIHKSYDTYDSNIIKHNEILIDKPKILGFVWLELSNSQLYETFYDNLQPYFGENNINYNIWVTESPVISIKAVNMNESFYNVKDQFDFGNINEENDFFHKRKPKGGW